MGAFQRGAFQAGAFQDATAVRQGGDGGGSARDTSRRKFLRERYVRNRHTVLRDPEPPRIPQPARKVTREAVREAVEATQFPGSVSEAQAIVPRFVLPLVGQSATRADMLAAVRGFIEQDIARRIAEDESDIELLLLAA